MNEKLKQVGILSGKSTTAILEILPQKKIEMILQVSRSIKSDKGKVDRYKNLPKKDKFPNSDIEKIRNLLEKHQTKQIKKGSKMVVKNGWIEKGDVISIMEFIWIKFSNSPKGKTALRADAKEVTSKNETRPSDLGLNLAVYCLAELLKRKTKKPNWKLICGFLEEQELINNYDYDEFSLKDRYRHLKPKKLEKLYDDFKMSSILPESVLHQGSIFSKCFDQELIRECDTLFPPLQDLIS
ncbi:MAG: hypothetical protein HZA01_04060 [Nitrospinae bacterium]|nr:hypothetical protein [Nitrospinota bacterium]